MAAAASSSSGGDAVEPGLLTGPITPRSLYPSRDGRVMGMAGPLAGVDGPSYGLVAWRERTPADDAADAAADEAAAAADVASAGGAAGAGAAEGSTFAVGAESRDEPSGLVTVLMAGMRESILGCAVVPDVRGAEHGGAAGAAAGGADDAYLMLAACGSNDLKAVSFTLNSRVSGSAHRLSRGESLLVAGEPLGLAGAHTDDVNCVAAGPPGVPPGCESRLPALPEGASDYQVVVTGSDDRSVVAFELATRTRLWRQKTAHQNFVLAVEVTSDGAYVISGDHAGRLCCISVATGDCIWSKSKLSSVWHISISPDDKHIVGTEGSSGGWAVFDRETGDTHGKPPNVRDNFILWRETSFLPTGQLVCVRRGSRPYVILAESSALEAPLARIAPHARLIHYMEGPGESEFFSQAVDAAAPHLRVIDTWAHFSDDRGANRVVASPATGLTVLCDERRVMALHGLGGGGRLTKRAR